MAHLKKKEMPSIEIISINSKELHLKQTDFEVAIIESHKLETHRGLFYELFRKQSGTIIHIGNPEFKEEKEGCFFGGQIIDWDFEPNDQIVSKFDCNNSSENSEVNLQNRFKFLEKYVKDIDRILRISLENSSSSKVYFLTDYQFGSEKEKTETIDTIDNFWALHDREGIAFNTLYEMSTTRKARHNSTYM
jgi:hypothetical protein